MRKLLFVAGGLLLAFSSPAKAEFNVSSAILEFTSDGPRQQDVELISRSKDNDYVVAEIAEIVHPGMKDENRRKIDDPSSGILLVTPDKTILAGGSRKVMRFVLLKDPDAEEHIYRVAVKPVIKGVDKGSKVGIKVLVGYEVLAIVRPANMNPAYTAVRQGKKFTVTNSGNTNILFQNGKQCETCKLPPVVRVYPGQTAELTLPADQAVTYQIWNGKETVEKEF